MDLHEAVKWVQSFQDSTGPFLRSLCKRKHVVCGVFYRNKRVLRTRAIQENGPPGDQVDLCTGVIGDCGCIHAEQRAARFSARGKNLVWITTYSPCLSCANLAIALDSVKEWYWLIDAPHHPRGPERLKEFGIKGGLYVAETS